MAACRSGSVTTSRLDRSLSAIQMKNPLSHEQWRAVFERLDAAAAGTGPIDLPRVTRAPILCATMSFPDCRAERVRLHNGQSTQTRAAAARGISAITLDDIRWHRCDIKATTLLANVLAVHAPATRRSTMQSWCVTAWQMEGTASNLFIVHDGLLITPPEGTELLSGITRDLVLELAQEAGVPYAQARRSVLPSWSRRTRSGSPAPPAKSPPWFS